MHELEASYTTCVDTNSREHEAPEGYRVRWRFIHRVEATSDRTPVHDIFRSRAGDGPLLGELDCGS